MTSFAAEYADRLAWQFRKSGGPGRHAQVFGDLDEDLRARIAQAAGLSREEVPAIVCYFDDDSWVLLTSARLVWRTSGGTTSVANTDLADATVDKALLLGGGRRGKLGVRTLAVVTTTGERHLLSLEEGGAFSGFWNSLKTVAADNRRPQ